ncbi:MAG: hypothetical protein ACOYL3_00115 [Desulfuromonadaceae bacterium]
MLYRLITSGYTDAFAYISALCAALWIFAAWQYAALMPGYLAMVTPVYGLVVAAFSGALLIGKYICLEGNAEKVSLLTAEKSMLEAVVKGRDLTLADVKLKAAALHAEISALRDKIAVMEENSPDKQLSELRTRLRSAEEDKKSALSVLVKSLRARIGALMTITDPQLLFAADVLRQEVGLVENELKRGELTYYELCLKMVDISAKIVDLNEINIISSFEQTEKPDSVAETWLHFIRTNDSPDPAAVERAFKFFKVAFHPDKFASEAQKVEATRYFQQSINAHNSVKRMENAAP